MIRLEIVPVLIPASQRGDHRQVLIYPGQVLLIGRHFQSRDLHQKRGEIIDADLFDPALRNVVIGPENEARDIAALLRFIIHGGDGLPHHLGIEAVFDKRLMIAEHQNDGRFILLPEIADEVFKGLVGFFDQGEILVRLRILSFCGSEIDRLIKVVKDLVVAGVGLHGHVEQEKRLIRFFFLVHFFDLLKIVGVADVTSEDDVLAGIALFEQPLVQLIAVSGGLVAVQDIFVDHILDGDEIAKPHQIINADPVPAAGVIGMKGVCSVALGQKRGDKARLLLFDIELIGVAASRKEGHGVAGEELILRVACAGSDGGNVHVALDRVFIHAVDEGHKGFVRLQIADHPKIGEALVHDDDQVRRDPLLPCGRYGDGLMSSVGIHPLTDQRGLQNARRGFLAAGENDVLDLGGVISGRLHQPEIFCVQREFQNRTMMVVAPGLVEEVGLEAVVRDIVCIEKCVGKTAHHQQSQKSGDDFCRELPFRHIHPGGQRHKRRGKGNAEENLIAYFVSIACRHVGRRLDAPQVHGDQRTALELLDIHIGDSKQQENGTHRHDADPDAAAEPEDEQIQQRGDHIVCQDVFVAGQEIRQKIAVEPLHRDHHDKRGGQEKDQYRDRFEPPGGLPPERDPCKHKHTGGDTDGIQQGPPVLQRFVFGIGNGDRGQKNHGNDRRQPNGSPSEFHRTNSLTSRFWDIICSTISSDSDEGGIKCVPV